MTEHESRSAYSRWLAHNARGPEPDPWHRVGISQARTYRGGIADDPTRFEEER